MNGFETGILLGKFMPPTEGHKHLAGVGQEVVKDMHIIVETRDDDVIPGELRFNWMKELFPRSTIHRLHKNMPQSPKEHPDFWNLWRNTLLPFLGGKTPDILFASDNYGAPLAECLDARFFPVDPGRESINISATMIRENPFKYWDKISEPAKEFFTHKIALVGPESTGKSVLAAKMAEKYNTTWVREFASNILKFKKDFTIHDAVDGAIGHKADIKILSRQANRVLLVDSDAMTTKVWCQTLFSQVPDIVNNIASHEHYDMTFLFSPDTPYVDDEHRKPEWQQYRQDMFYQIKQELEGYGRPYCIVSGTWDERETMIEQYIRNTLSSSLLTTTL